MKMTYQQAKDLYFYKVKCIDGSTITFWTLAGIAATSAFKATVGFAVVKVLSWVWDKPKPKI